MNGVKELRHHLVIEMADEGPRPHPDGWKADLADAEKEVDALISAVRKEEMAKIRKWLLDDDNDAITAIPFGNYPVNHVTVRALLDFLDEIDKP